MYKIIINKETFNALKAQGYSPEDVVNWFYLHAGLDVEVIVSEVLEYANS